MREEHILRTAALWHARQGNDDMDWPAFEAWLGEDPRHREAFDDIALLDDDVDRHRDLLRTLATAGHRHGRRARIAGGSLAAVAVASLAVVLLRAPPPPENLSPAATYGTAATARDIRIAAANVTLAPRSSVTTASGDPTALALVGRAVFDVKHDPARVLTIRAAGFDIRDVGTRFEIVSGGGTIRVAVAEGEVTVRAAGAGGTPVRVTAGLAATGFADGRIVTTRQDTGRLGGWRTGPLVYSAMPLALVTADVARATGTSITIDDAIGTRPFSGVLATGDRDTMVAALAALSGLEARRQGNSIHLRPRSGR